MSSSNTDPVLKLGLEHGGSPDPGLNRYFVGPVCGARNQRWNGQTFFFDCSIFKPVFCKNEWKEMSLPPTPVL